MFQSLINSFTTHSSLNAFCINDKFYTYLEFAEKVSGLVQYIKTKQIKNQNIGIVTYNDIETYASIYATWFSGNTFIPLHFKNPAERNNLIIEQAGLEVILSSKSSEITDKCLDIAKAEIIYSYQVEASHKDIELPALKEESNMYILYTSGSTGTPKGVPISLKNINAFLDAFSYLNFNISEEDRFLQMFDLTFDVSVACTLLPLIAGSCVYTVPSDSVKYTYVYKLLKNKNITFATLVPSLLSYLKPYFKDINLPALKYCILTAEASQQMMVEEWSNCVPNAEIVNLYGPTEATIWCTGYTWSRKENKHYNGFISIGKPFNGLKAVIIDENNKVVTAGTKGEMCISGDQVTSGYWNDSEKNQKAFITLKVNGSDHKFYKTGDLCYIDEAGDIMYCGRIDNQVQIQGFRVELSEIEHIARGFLGNINIAAIATKNEFDNTEIKLFTEGFSGDLKELTDYLKSRLPFYMLPSKIINLEKFPVNSSNKIDRRALMNS
jgi:amino acid adenylation domain-containing protein